MVVGNKAVVEDLSQRDEILIHVVVVVGSSVSGHGFTSAFFDCHDEMEKVLEKFAVDRSSGGRSPKPNKSNHHTDSGHRSPLVCGQFSVAWVTKSSWWAGDPGRKYGISYIYSNFLEDICVEPRYL